MFFIRRFLKIMKLKDYYFELPENLIAQNPAEKRDQSKLMAIDRCRKTIEHKNFYDIENYLRDGDVLVINESKVIPARLFGKREDTGASVEFLLLEQIAQIEQNDAAIGICTWKIIMKPAKKGKKHTVFTFGGGSSKLKAEILEILDDGCRLVKFYCDNGAFYKILDEIGVMPLPPYIKDCTLEETNVKERYQTVYARESGSSAAPTAGLHFTDRLLEKIRAKGVITAPVTLHVGLGTFRPVKTENIREHKMHEEYYYISEESAEIINKAKRENRRIIAVGTTSCRTLEACWSKHGAIKSGGDYTDIFIYEGYKFQVIDALITNFHLPESTLLMLVSAFYSKDEILRAYNTAVENKYSFFSFGDAMFIY